MGKYIRNGETMWGTSNKAENIAYQDTNVKLELDEINNNLTANDGTQDIPFRYAMQDGVDGRIMKVDGADTFIPFSQLLINVSDSVVHHSNGNWWSASDVYNLTDDIVVTNNVTNATSTAYADVIDLILTFSKRRKVKILVNGLFEITASRNQKLSFDMKHNDTLVYSDSVTNEGNFKVEEVFVIDAKQNDVISIKFNTNNYYNKAILSVTVF